MSAAGIWTSGHSEMPVHGEERPRPDGGQASSSSEVRRMSCSSSSRGGAGMTRVKKAPATAESFSTPQIWPVGLTGRHWTLPEALAAFTGEVIDERAGHADITCRQRLTIPVPRCARQSR